MSIATDTISIYRGDTYPFAVRVLNYDGTVFDLTDYTMTITVKSESATEIDEDFPCTTSPTLGIAYGQLSSVMTAMDIADDYTYDIAISGTPTGESVAKVYTVAIGTLAILQDVSDSPTFVEYTLRPNGAGNLTQLDKNGGSFNWDRVDEEIADDFTSTVSDESGSTKYDYYTIPDTIYQGTIAEVTVHVRCWKDDASGANAICLRTHSTNYAQARLMLSTLAWVDDSYTWTTNPNTGLAWTWHEITELEIGVGLKGFDDVTSKTTYCTQIYVVITPA